MSLIKASTGLFENYTFIARPTRAFSSSSSGLTGALRVFQQASPSEKYTEASDSFNDENLGTALLAASSGSDVSSAISKYIELVSSSSTSPRMSKKVEVLRFEPSFGFTSDTVRKSVVKDVLYPYYRSAYPTSYWGYSNYLSLNFISGSQFGTGSALVYANPTVASQPLLTPSGAFTFEFFVKPTMRVSGTYPAGTIMHVSSSFSLSLVSGSSIDPLGKPDSFRIMLQLSQSSEISPSSVDLSLPNNTRSSPSDLIFLSDDLITFNGWHHIAVRWGGSSTDFGTGSFFIDGSRAGSFYIPSESVTRTDYAEHSKALFVGNFYEGVNSSTGSNTIEGFFNSSSASTEGFTNPYGNVVHDIPQHEMRHPLAAELHEIRIWQEFRSLSDIRSYSAVGLPSKGPSLRFYLPPVFSHESLEREVLYTPFQTITTSTDAPYATQLSFGVGGHLINAENHIRDRVSGYFPRLLNMTASVITQQNLSSLEANQFLFATASNVRKNLLILPCDNGKFYPNFLLFTTSSYTPHFGTTPGFVELDEMLGSPNDFDFENESMEEEIAGVNPTSMSGTPGNSLTIYQRTRDQSSNLVTFFDASNLFYGSKIHPGTYELADPSFTGSAGLVSFRIRDNGMGGLYRADATTPHAKWNSVGTLLYEEGIAAITSPYFGELFGKDAFSVSFRGEQPMPLLTTNIVVPAYQINSSSMPSYLPLTASDYANEVGDPIVYITRVNFHDENLNVVGRAELAQPIAKRLADKFLLKIKFDF